MRMTNIVVHYLSSTLLAFYVKLCTLFTFLILYFVIYFDRPTLLAFDKELNMLCNKFLVMYFVVYLFNGFVNFELKLLVA